MRTARSRWLVMVLVALTGSQLGHLVAYQLRLGPQGVAAQSQGAHQYFPALVGASAASLGAALLVGLLVIGAARLLLGRHRGSRLTGGLPLLESLAFLFTLQLAIYAGQEFLETWLFAAAPSPAPQLLLWGTLGQLPVAAVAALSLGWISARIDSAIEVLRTTPTPRRSPVPSIALPPAALSGTPALSAMLQACAPAVFVKRGPPPNLLHRI